MAEMLVPGSAVAFETSLAIPIAGRIYIIALPIRPYANSSHCFPTIRCVMEDTGRLNLGIPAETSAHSGRACSLRSERSSLRRSFRGCRKGARPCQTSLSRDPSSPSLSRS
jgi:hypothetical protein